MDCCRETMVQLYRLKRNEKEEQHGRESTSRKNKDEDGKREQKHDRQSFTKEKPEFQHPQPHITFTRGATLYEESLQLQPRL